MSKDVKPWRACARDAMLFILIVATATVILGCFAQYFVDKAKGLL